MKKTGIMVLMILAILTLSIGCTENDGTEVQEKEITLGSKAFTEGVLVSEIYAQVLENEGFKVERKFNLGTPDILQKAIEKGDIDLYPEYTGTGLTVILGKAPMTDDDEVYKVVKDAYKEQYNLVWLEQAPLNNTHAIVLMKDQAEAYDLETLSDMAPIADQFIIGAKPEFKVREDGLPGLQDKYGGFNFKEVKSYQSALRYKALVNGEIDATVAFTTDGQIKKYGLAVLKDDKKLWPPYHVAPVIRADVLESYPEVKVTLNKVTALLTDEVMQDLNWQIDGEKKEFGDVAKAFLTRKGVIEK